MGEQDKSKGRQFWNIGSRYGLSSAQDLKALIEKSGIDPDGEYAQTLLTLHATANEELLADLKQPLIQQAAERIVQGRVFPVIRKSKQEGIFIGTSTDLYEDGAKIYLPMECLKQHCGIFGMTGSGKSYLLKFIVAQLIKMGVTVLVFDLEGEFSCLLPLFPRDQLLYAKPSWLKINPFEARGDPDDWRAKIVSLIRSIYYLRDGSAELLSRILKQLYETRGCLRGTGNWPSPQDLLAHLTTLKFAKTTKSSSYLESLFRCTRSLTDRLGSTLNVSQGMDMAKLASKSMILNVEGLDPQELEFFICFLLEASGSVMKSQQQRVIVLEEASVLLNLIRQRREDLGEPPIQQAFRRLRKRNSNFIIVDQAPGLIPESVHANLGTRIVGTTVNKKCQNVLKTAMGLQNEKSNTMSSFPKKIFAYQNIEIGTTILVRSPDLSFPSPPAEKDLEQEMKNILNSLLPEPREQENQPSVEEKPIQREPASQNNHEVSGTEQKEPGENEEDPVRDMVMSPGSRGPSLAALRYLEQWNQPNNQFLTLTRFDKKQGGKTTKGNSLREELENAEMIEIKDIRTGKKGQHKTIQILEKGFKALKEMGVKSNPLKGKGGFESQFWAVQICRNLTKTVPGSNPRIEDVKMGKAVDVAAKVDGKLKAYEISMTPNWTTQNVVKDILAGYHEVVICAVKPEDIKAIKKKLQTDLEQGQREDKENMLSKVSFQLLRTFLQ